MAIREGELSLDELDIEIIRHLNQDARKSFRDMARELGVSTSTVSARVKRLEKGRVITGYLPAVDQRKVGYDLPAVVGLRISKGKLLEVQRKIAEDPRVFGVHDVTGEWDSIVMARFRNTAELDGFVKGVLAQPYVERTYTQVVLNTVKDEKRVLI